MDKTIDCSGRGDADEPEENNYEMTEDCDDDGILLR